MKIDRETARTHLLGKYPVLHNGKLLESPRQLPPEEAGGDYVALRRPGVGLTRAGMEYKIRHGEGILLPGGQVVTTLAELPPDDVLAAGDSHRLEEVLREHDDRLAQALQDRERTRKQLERVQADARMKAAHPPEPVQNAPELHIMGAAPGVNAPEGQHPVGSPVPEQLDPNKASGKDDQDDSTDATETGPPNEPKRRRKE